MGSVAITDCIVEHKILHHLHLQLLSTFVTITSDHSVSVNRRFGTTVLFGVQHHYWMGCSTITIRLLSNIWTWRAITSTCLQLRDLNGLLLYILRLGYGFFLLVLYHCGPRWLVGGEWILFSFYLSGNIIFWSFRFSVYFSLSWHAGVGGQGRIAFFSHLSKGAVLQILQRGSIFLFHGAKVDMLWLFSLLSFLYWAGRTTGAGYFWWTCVWISISYLKRDHYLLFCLTGREWQLFWIWFCVRLFSCSVFLFPYTIISSGFHSCSFVRRACIISYLFYFDCFGCAYLCFSFSVSCFFGACVNTFDLLPFAFSVLVFISALAAVWNLRFRAV